MIKFVLSGLSLLLVFCATAQNGFVRGNIADGDFGGAMIGATVTLGSDPSKGTTTDFDGNFSLELPPGTYTINVSFISFTTQTFTDVEVKPGEVTIIDATLTSNAAELAVFEVSAEVRRNSEVAMLMDMKNATNVSDGLTAQSFRKVGDADLGGAMKRITGVTIQDGKYVYVRGLGDRYTKTNLNGMALPGLDPDANSIQIDIFPTTILENVSVFKTFSPDLDGDFTGGLVNIVTKSFPEKKYTQFSFGATFIPGMHFNSDYILYNGGGMEWAAMGASTRELPVAERADVPAEVENDPELESITRSFDSELGAKNKTALPNTSFSFSHGNQINTKSESTFGYNVVFNYQNQNIFYDNFESNDYLKSNDLDEEELVEQVSRVGIVGKNNVQWTGLVSGSYKKGGSKLTATFLNTQSGESSASQRINRDVEQNQSTLVEDVLTYTQRNLRTFLLNGSHKVGRAEITWANALSFSQVNDPDFRETRISITDGDTSLATGTGAGIDRFWRDLNEINESAKVDFKYTINERLSLKTGAIGTVKNRTFDVFSFKHRTTNLSDVPADPDWFLQEENIWSVPADPSIDPEGTYTIGNYQPANSYEAFQTLFGGFLMAEQSVLKKRLKLIYGVRIEKIDMYYTGENNTASEVYNREKTLNELNILPSLNAVIVLTEKINLRLGANHTVARPSFKEKSIAQIYDPITKRTFVGNIDLEQTNINNFDTRFEYFLGAKELISVAVFYKQFDGHIELVSFPTAPDNFKPRNSGDASVLGAEFEIRKGLPNVSSTFLSRWFIATNVSIVRSAVALNSVIVDDQTGQTEYELREENLRTNQEASDFRPMAGQSPYAINFTLSYEIPESKTNFSLAYNVQGEQLTIIGSGRVPDIYTLPFHSMNFNAFRSFGKDQNHKVTVSLNNILDDDRSLVYRSFGAEDQFFTTFKPGRGIGLKYGYTF